ncbi:MAG: DUF5615 family PIN-like protein [Planctomycetes bacterium]|nr:DUF5615 family PIN-like protein [Planctomycetota bacterium]
MFDQNLSRRLAQRLADIYPGSVHVGDIGFDRETDANVWEYARRDSFVLVSKDADFVDLVAQRGPPPSLVWLRVGNCTTRSVEQLLRVRLVHIVHAIETAGAPIVQIE